jgi:hypothetical protein
VTRTLDWDGCFNVRDLGGLPLEDGGETRRGVLVRSDSVRKLSDDGWRSLEAHGIERIVDLRWPEELAEDPPRELALDVVHVSLLGTYDPDFRDDVDEFMATGDPAGPVCFRLAGVPAAEVGADYALSAVLLAHEPPRPDASARRRFMQHISPESMQRAIEHVERVHGSVAGYLRACGLDDGRIGRLRELLRP